MRGGELEAVRRVVVARGEPRAVDGMASVMGKAGPRVQ